MKRPSRTVRLIILALAVLFLAACLGYFHLCRQLGLAMQWIFLIGFLPSWPLAVPAARSNLPGSGGSKPANPLTGQKYPAETFMVSCFTSSFKFMKRVE